MPRPKSAARLKKEAREAVGEAIPEMKALAMSGDKQAVAAFSALSKVAGVSGGGIQIKNQIGIDARNHGDTKGDWLFFQKFRNRLEKGIARQYLPGADEGEDARVEVKPDPV